MRTVRQKDKKQKPRDTKMDDVASVSFWSNGTCEHLGHKQKRKKASLFLFSFFDEPRPQTKSVKPHLVCSLRVSHTNMNNQKQACVLPFTLRCASQKKKKKRKDFFFSFVVSSLCLSKRWPRSTVIRPPGSSTIRGASVCWVGVLVGCPSKVFFFACLFHNEHKRKEALEKMAFQSTLTANTCFSWFSRRQTR